MLAPWQLRLLSFAVACVWVSTALADVPVRYNDPVAALPRNDLERRVEALVAEVAQAERRTPPRPEARLGRAAVALAQVPAEAGGPSNDLVEAALRLYGIVEPSPHIILVSASAGADDAVVAELRSQLGRALGSGRYTRVAAAAVTSGEHLRVLVALQESYLELEPVPRALRDGGPTQLKGRLLGGFERPSAFVTTPDGHANPLPLFGDAKRFSGTFRCGAAKGRYQLEITGEDRFGSTVLANFPIACGVPAATTLSAPRHAEEAPIVDASQAEAALLTLVNADRAKAGLRPLVADPRLADVARAHCRDMLTRGFVGHVSPTTGSAADRVARAKIGAALILENVARAYTPGEVERGLMESPGHRRNILSAEAQRIGVGAVLSEALGGQRELLVTQLFIAAEAPFRASSAIELRNRISELRRSRGLTPFIADAELDRIADGVARDLASGRATPDSARAPLDRAIAHLGSRYQSVRSLFAVATEIGQVIEAMKEPLATRGPIAIGVGLAVGVAPRSDGHPDEGHMAHHAVLLLAVPRAP